MSGIHSLRVMRKNNMEEWRLRQRKEKLEKDRLNSLRSIQCEIMDTRREVFNQRMSHVSSVFARPPSSPHPQRLSSGKDGHTVTFNFEDDSDNTSSLLDFDEDDDEGDVWIDFVDREAESVPKSAPVSLLNRKNSNKTPPEEKKKLFPFGRPLSNTYFADAFGCRARGDSYKQRRNSFSGFTSRGQPFHSQRTSANNRNGRQAVRATRSAGSARQVQKASRAESARTSSASTKQSSSSRLPGDPTLDNAGYLLKLHKMIDEVDTPLARRLLRRQTVPVTNNMFFTNPVHYRMASHSAKFKGIEDMARGVRKKVSYTAPTIASQQRIMLTMASSKAPAAKSQ
ncbi:uncharacterized protein [Ptychodera flava]|uniref:uncharacterized protein n=1 Tax=Ptychodera flava TaxID=63121 RepID=UPI00396A0DA7